MAAKHGGSRVVGRSLVVGAAVAVLAAFAMGALRPASGGSSSDVTDEATPVTEVPDSIPSNGVNINDQWVLTPPSANTNGIITSEQAKKAATQYADTGIEPATLLADVTVPGTIPPVGIDIPFSTIENREAWVVTFTSKEPVAVGVQKADGSPSPRLMDTHYSVVLDASTGEYLMGFYTK